MAGDVFFEKNGLLLPGNGTDGSTSIIDLSLAARVPTSVGAVTVSTAQSKYGGASLRLPKSNPLVYAAGSHWDLSISAWTWEMWVYELSGSGTTLISRRQSGTGTGWSFGTKGVRAKINGSWSDAQQLWDQPALNAWNHWAWVRNGSSLTVYINGTGVHTKTGVTTIEDLTGIGLYFGQADNSGESRFDGYLDDVRFTSGQARYTGNFTPPVAAHPTYAGTISGVVLDDAGAFAERKIAAYYRDTLNLAGQATSSASDGAYSILCQRFSECNVIAQDDSSGTFYNDKILRVMPGG